MSTTWMVVMVGAVLVGAGTLALVAARLLQALRVIVHLEQHITRLQEGTNLLTDTVELGFRQVAAELERLGQQAPATVVRPPAARPTTARVKAASTRGRSVREIAAAEQVSEGEVRLRLSLAEAGAKTRPSARAKSATSSRAGRTKGTTDAALRA